MTPEEKRKVTRKAHYEANKERLKAKQRAYYEANKEKSKAYYETNKEKISAYNKAYHESNKEKILSKKKAYQRVYRKANKEKVAAYNKDYQKTNKDLYLAHSRKRETAKLDRTPPWLTQEHIDEMKGIYSLRERLTEETGTLHHVDHIIPLKGKDISGLHVPWNLQVIPAAENLSKHNNYEEERIVPKELRYG